MIALSVNRQLSLLTFLFRRGGIAGYCSIVFLYEFVIRRRAILVCPSVLPYSSVRMTIKVSHDLFTLDQHLALLK